MGYYIQTPERHGKVDWLIANYQGEEIAPPNKFEEIPAGKALIVIVDNGPFEAAGFVYDAGEFNDFRYDNTRRPKRYVLLDEKIAAELAGYRLGMV